MRLSALVLCIALLGSAAAQAPLVSLSGMRAKFFMKHPHLAKHLLPPPPAVSGAPGSSMTPTAIPANCLSVAEVAQSAGNFSTLLAVAQAAGMASALSDRSLQATVFAPTDAAFALLLASLDVTADQLLAEPALLQAVLKYHVVPGAALTSADLYDSQELDTLLSADIEAEAAASAGASAGRSSSWIHHGKEAAAEAEDGTLTMDVKKVYSLKSHEQGRMITVVGSMSAGEVTAADINAGCPAVIHVIDAVLLPSLPTEEVAAPAGVQPAASASSSSSAGIMG